VYAGSSVEMCNCVVLIAFWDHSFLKNKRAQRALGRSPEEKIKSHSEAIYKGPLMLSHLIQRMCMPVRMW